MENNRKGAATIAGDRSEKKNLHDYSTILRFVLAILSVCFCFHLTTVEKTAVEGMCCIVELFALFIGWRILDD